MPQDNHLDALYCKIINTVQSHCCGLYCKRKDGDGCSKNFPIPLCGQKLVSVVQVKRKNGAICTKMELYSNRNDQYLNPLSKYFLLTFKANMDIRLTIDIGKFINYMCKYVTKSESLHATVIFQFSE